MSSSAVVLHSGKEKAILNRHQWIFSGAVKSAPDFENGALLPVRAADGRLLGTAYFNRKCSIVGRMIAFGDEPPLDALRRKLLSAIELRRKMFDFTKTDAVRFVNGEGDGLPGLVVDGYADVLVIQVTTLGIEKLKSEIVDTLVAALKPTAVYERSDMATRREEGLKDQAGTLYGEAPKDVIVRENGLKFTVDFKHGQKTGFFLDQREMRALVEQFSAGRKVLNCFSYTGGFSAFAARGGATRADSVDISPAAVAAARKNFELNGFPAEAEQFVAADVFEHLRQIGSEYDFIILDPPAFAKKKDDVIRAGRGYKDVNRQALLKVAPGGFVLTCSCSHFVDEKLFQQIIFQAACEAGRTVRVIQRHHHATDHPVSIFHPEGNYLKSLLLAVE